MSLADNYQKLKTEQIYPLDIPTQILISMQLYQCNVSS